MSITTKKFTIQSEYYWENEDDQFFDTIEEAIEYFRVKMPNSAVGVVVQKVALIRDETVKNRDVKVEVQ